MKSIEKKIIVKNRLGLHARPAALFVQIANKFNASITVSKDDQEVNGKSIMGILMLAAETGSTIIITASGDDAQEAILELEKIVSIEDIEDDFRSKKVKDVKAKDSGKSRRHGNGIALADKDKK